MVSVCVCVCARALVCACVRTCMCVRVRVHVHLHFSRLPGSTSFNQVNQMAGCIVFCDLFAPVVRCALCVRACVLWRCVRVCVCACARSGAVCVCARAPPVYVHVCAGALPVCVCACVGWLCVYVCVCYATPPLLRNDQVYSNCTACGGLGWTGANGVANRVVDERR